MISILSTVISSDTKTISVFPRFFLSSHNIQFHFTIPSSFNCFTVTIFKYIHTTIHIFSTNFQPWLSFEQIYHSVLSIPWQKISWNVIRLHIKIDFSLERSIFQSPVYKQSSLFTVEHFHITTMNARNDCHWYDKYWMYVCF